MSYAPASTAEQNIHAMRVGVVIWVLGSGNAGAVGSFRQFDLQRFFSSEVSSIVIYMCGFVCSKFNRLLLGPWTGFTSSTW